MSNASRALLGLIYVVIFSPFLFAAGLPAILTLSSPTTTATFGPRGLILLEDTQSRAQITFAQDDWLLAIDSTTLRSSATRPRVEQVGRDEIKYDYRISGYHIRVVYQLRMGWGFVSKQLWVLRTPATEFTVHRVLAWDLRVRNEVRSAYVPSTYVPQFGATIDESRTTLPGKDFGEFLRVANGQGVLLTIQNPFLEAGHDGQTASLGYAPEMAWRQSWGEFASDLACIGTYSLSGRRLPRQMILEWQAAGRETRDDGMDLSEISAFTACVRAFLIDPAPQPVTVEVGWTLNDYQIDVGTPEGQAEYKRIIDATAELGIKNLLYAPANSTLSVRAHSTDSWGWEYVLWLNLGEKIRSGGWNPLTDPIPASVTEMLSYARRKHVGLLAYVYPSVPYEKNRAWIVKGKQSNDPHNYATLASRDLQDYLIRNLIAFQKRTGISGYSFDYAFLDLPTSSSYSQWYGLRRVIESVRRAAPSIIIDGRQTYQCYGPWSWVAGSYPHPTGNDEQAESFKPYPDLHFDRVSADRTRFVNYWYRNYQFAPAEIIPGYATHQVERLVNIPADTDTVDDPPKAEMIYTRYRPRNWDYLGYRYSFLSSIATGGWNNVVNMIPARDLDEWKHFSAKDKTWIREWLSWTVTHKEYLRNTRTILDQPALGHVDGTSAIVGNRGYLFLFNPNYKQLPADFVLDESVGLSEGTAFLLRQIYPDHGRVIGKPGMGVWSRGDKVHLDLPGTSATVLEVLPPTLTSPIIFNAEAAGSDEMAEARAALTRNRLSIEHIGGEYGSSQEIGILLPLATKITRMTVNGRDAQFLQNGRYIGVRVNFAGEHFNQDQEVPLTSMPGRDLLGKFAVPHRIFEELAARKKAWPIPWTSDDYNTTWLAPERLLLFLQFVDGSETIPISASLDDRPLKLEPAYSSIRIHPASFVGFYADLSAVDPDKQHILVLSLPEAARAKLQGAFFDNVEPQFTEEVIP
jgi:hypothetical protein